KVVHPHLRESREMALALVDEAKLAARLRHPNVVTVFDVADDEEGLFLVMEYVEGETLAGLFAAARRDGGWLGPRIGLCWLLDALEGLEAAHELRDARGA